MKLKAKNHEENAELKTVLELFITSVQNGELVEERRASLMLSTITLN